MFFCTTHQYSSFQIISGPRGVWSFVKTLPNLVKHGPGLKIYVSGVNDYEIASFSYSQSKLYVQKKYMREEVYWAIKAVFVDNYASCYLFFRM